jgi:hypothetical protein
MTFDLTFDLTSDPSWDLRPGAPAAQTHPEAARPQP